MSLRQNVIDNTVTDLTDKLIGHHSNGVVMEKGVIADGDNLVMEYPVTYHDKDRLGNETGLTITGRLRVEVVGVDGE